MAYWRVAFVVEVYTGYAPCHAYFIGRVNLLAERVSVSSEGREVDISEDASNSYLNLVVNLESDAPRAFIASFSGECERVDSFVLYLCRRLSILCERDGVVCVLLEFSIVVSLHDAVDVDGISRIEVSRLDAADAGIGQVCRVVYTFESQLSKLQETITFCLADHEAEILVGA